MIVLSAATYTLQLILSAGTADVDVSYVDRTATAYPIGATEQTAATATTQTICSAPAASTSREIDFLSVKIKTTGGVVTIQKLNSSGAVTTQLISVTLLDEEVLQYTHAGGWCALDANGNRKEATSSAFGAITVTNLTDSALTSGRVTYAGTGGLLQDSANLTFNGTTLTANALAVTNGTTLSGVLTYGGVTLSNAVTGTGSMVLSASPTFTGTVSAAAITASGNISTTDGALAISKASGNAATFTDATTYTYAISSAGFGGTLGTLALPIIVNAAEVARFTSAGINGVLGGTTPAAASVTTLAASSTFTGRTILPDTNAAYNIGSTSAKYLVVYTGAVSDSGANGTMLSSSGTTLVHGAGSDWTAHSFGDPVSITGTLAVSPPFGSGIEISPTTDANNTATYLRLYGGAAFYSNRYVEISVFNNGGSNVNDMVFKTGNLGTVAEAMRLTYDGHLVAAGNGSFAGTLGVSGVVTFSNLAGVGTRNVVADASGNLSAP